MVSEKHFQTISMSSDVDVAWFLDGTEIGQEGVAGIQAAVFLQEFVHRCVERVNVVWVQGKPIDTDVPHGTSMALDEL